MNYLIQTDIYLINQMSIEQHGGNFNPPNNLLNEGSIAYVVEAVQSTVFGQAACPELQDKAGLYMFSIISNHAFSDGKQAYGSGSGTAIFTDQWLSIEIPPEHARIRHSNSKQ